MIAPMASLFIQPVVSSLINAISGKGVTRAGKGQESGFLPLLALPLMMKAMGNRFIRARREYNTMNHMAKKF